MTWHRQAKPAGNEELSRLLQYIENSIEENATTEELKDLHQYVTTIKKKKEVGVRYMKSWELEQMWRKEARKEGLAEGLQKGKIQSIIELLEYMGEVPDLMRERIEGETDEATLSRWLKLAAKVESFSEFEEKFQ